ncbi:IS3 family transposase, partial [Acinetobacter ursingii]|uniref:IS3 family transposase n=1 Tax=Acinetobacter ursingii TaxID=108980 RepID=UPI0035A2306E
APIESFWGILKNELVHHYNYQTREEAKADIIKYIELFYNHRSEPYRVCRRVNILRDYRDDKIKIYP